MARRRGIARRLPVIGEMFGRIQDDVGFGYSLSRFVNRVFGKGYKKTLDLTKNDYALFRALYHGSTVPQGSDQSSNGQEFILAAAFAAPIIDSAAAFAVGTGFTFELGGSSDNDAIKTAEDDVNRWASKNADILFDAIKFCFRDADSYLFMNENAEIEQLKPETVDVVTDPITGKVIGYDVTENVELVDSVKGEKQKWTYKKQYRTTFVRIKRWQENQDESKAEILYERFFTVDGAVDTNQVDDQGNRVEVQILQENIDERPLPIIHLANEPEPRYVYGVSDLQRVLVNMRNYTGVLEEATKRDIYNNNPVPVMRGVKQPQDGDAEQTDAKPDANDTSKRTDWDKDTVIYLNNPESDVKYLTIDNSMEGTKDLLQIYFFLILQASQTPEFILGNAVQSSKASTETQMPVVIAKAERKRRQMRRHLEELVRLYIRRQIELSNPDFFVFRGIDAEVNVQFPPIASEDGTLTLETIKVLLDQRLISGEKAVELALGDKIKDPSKEIEKAQEELIKAEQLQQQIRERLGLESSGGSGDGNTGGTSGGQGDGGTAAA